MSTIVEFPRSYNPDSVMHSQSPHYCLSEEQEFAITETRNALNGLGNLISSIPPDRTMHINADEVSALLSLLQARLPSTSIHKNSYKLRHI